nr:Flp family type IVb pilin [Desulforadius tongensis]
MGKTAAFWKDESGQALAEYALILGFILLACITVLTSLGHSIRDVFDPSKSDLGKVLGN